MKNTSSDPYQLQRIALLAARKGFSVKKLMRLLSDLSPDEQEQLLEMIVEQGLQFFWLDAVKSIKEHQFYVNSQERLKTSCLKSATRYLFQKKIIMEIDSLLNKADIVYALFKGAQIRETVYQNPAYRPSIDIDLLISPVDKEIVFQLLAAAGFTMHFDPANVSHEVNMIKEEVLVDVHWDIMRPGRTRLNMAEEFLRKRQRQEFFWGLDNEAALFVMLVHPVFTKYSTAPQSAIVRLVDIRNWIQCKEIVWSRLIEYVEKSGMKTASWITLSVLENLTDHRVPMIFYQTVVPAPLKKQILHYWLSRNLSSKFVNFPLVSKYIFTLLAHDSSLDVLRFFQLAVRARNQRNATIAKLQETVQNT